MSAITCKADESHGSLSATGATNRAKILAVENRRHIEAERYNLFPPDVLLIVRVRTKRDVMDGSSTRPTVDRFGMAQYIELGPDGSAAGVCRAQATPPGVFSDLTIAECLGQQFDGPLRRFNAQRHAPKPADRSRDIAVGLRGIDPFEAIDRRDLEPQPVRIAKFNHRT